MQEAWVCENTMSPQKGEKQAQFVHMDTVWPECHTDVACALYNRLSSLQKCDGGIETNQCTTNKDRIVTAFV